MTEPGFIERISAAELENIHTLYPWFEPAVREQHIRNSKVMPVWLSIRVGLRPLSVRRRIRFANAVAGTGMEKSCRNGFEDSDMHKQVSSMDIIDDFIRKGDHKIVVRDDTPDDMDVSQISPSGVLDDALATEEMAEIFLAQGLKNDAAKIYERLSLLNPEKSIYFAEIISRLKETVK